MIFGMILVCSMVLYPDVHDCTKTTAKSYTMVMDETDQPEVFNQPYACLVTSMTYAGAHVKVPAGFYPRVVCQHSRPENQG